MISVIKKWLCHFKGHKGLQRGQESDSIYYMLKDSGAFCQGITYIYGGRLYRCSRCGELHICRGVTSWELEDLISDTLKDIIPIYHNMFKEVDYNVCRIYK